MILESIRHSIYLRNERVTEYACKAMQTFSPAVESSMCRTICVQIRSKMVMVQKGKALGCWTWYVNKVVIMFTSSSPPPPSSFFLSSSPPLPSKHCSFPVSSCFCVTDGWGMKCTVMIWRSWVQTPVRSNLGCVVHLPKLYLNKTSFVTSTASGRDDRDSSRPLFTELYYSACVYLHSIKVKLASTVNVPHWAWNTVECLIFERALLREFRKVP